MENQFAQLQAKYGGPTNGVAEDKPHNPMEFQSHTENSETDFKKTHNFINQSVDNVSSNPLQNPTENIKLEDIRQRWFWREKLIDIQRCIHYDYCEQAAKGIQDIIASSREYELNLNQRNLNLSKMRKISILVF